MAKVVLGCRGRAGRLVCLECNRKDWVEDCLEWRIRNRQVAYLEGGTWRDWLWERLLDREVVGFSELVALLEVCGREGEELFEALDSFRELRRLIAKRFELG